MGALAKPKTDADLAKVSPLLKAWSDAVASGDVEKILEHYAENSRLCGTLFKGFVAKNDPDVDYQGHGRVMRDYFNELARGKDNLHVEWNDVKEVAPNTFKVDYSFVWNDQETGEEKILQADASFVSDEDGKIILHHSSVTPDNEMGGDAASSTLSTDLSDQSDISWHTFEQVSSNVCCGDRTVTWRDPATGGESLIREDVTLAFNTQGQPCLIQISVADQEALKPYTTELVHDDQGAVLVVMKMHCQPSKMDLL